jgi:hypothetical protein
MAVHIWLGIEILPAQRCSVREMGHGGVPGIEL